MRFPNVRPLRIGAAGSFTLVLALALAAALPAAATTYTWSNAGGGTWSDASSWSPNGIPSGAGDVAVLGTLGSPYVVALDSDPAAGVIQLADGATLALGAHSLGAASVFNHGTIQGFHGLYDGSKLHNLAGGTVTSADYDSIVVGDTLTNDGTIVVGPQLENAIFMVGSSRIEGSGSIRLVGLARINCPLARPQHEIQLTIGADQTLTGAGDVWVPVRNEGRIRQDAVGGPRLILHTYLFNYGTIRVQDGGWINMDCPTIWQYGGTIEGNDGLFTLNVGPGNLGTIDNLHGGRLVADGGDLRISTLQILEGHVEQSNGAGEVAIQYYSDCQNLVVDSGAILRVDGLMDLGVDGSTLLNHGTVKVRGTLNILGFPGNNISFTGDGQVVMDGGTLGTPAGAVLTNAAGHTITGCGTITANIDNQGTISVDCSGLSPSLTLKDGSITNKNRLAVVRGSLVLHGDRLINRGTLDGSAGTIKVEAGATLENQAGAKPVLAGPGHFWIGWKTPASTIQGGTLEVVNGGDYTNVGQAVLKDVRVDAGSTFQTLADATTRASGARFDLLGVNRISGTGAFVVDPATEYNQSTGVTVLDGGTLTVPGGYTVQGTLRGRGTVIGNVANDGEIAPDVAVDALKIQGDYRQSQAGHITIDLAGAASGQFARLAVSGNADLAGSARVTTSGGFSPAAGQEFAILTSTTRNGEFAEVAADPGVLLSAVYGSAGVTLASQSTDGGIEPAALPRTLRLAPRGMGFVLELPEAADVSVRAYDVRGREVAVLAEGARPAGFHALDLAKAAPGLGNGVYFARATVTGKAGRDVKTARVVFLR